MHSSVKLRLLYSFAIAAFACFFAGCAPKIGDACVLSTDCALDGTRQCDTSQPNGYCTIFDCSPNSCPDYAACVLFEPAVPGCSYTDRGVGRTSRSFCMAGCKSNGDCRDGFICVDPRKPPWSALILDDNQGQTVCVVNPNASVEEAGAITSSPDAEAPVCQAAPDIDAALPPLADSGPPPAGDAGDAGDAGADAGAPDAAHD